jgi:hypothetical protein
MTEYDVKCNQENKVIGHLVKKDNDAVTVDALAFIRNWRPVSETYRFQKRPKEGRLLTCPRCNGQLSISGECVMNESKISENPDGLLIGQFNLE